MNIRNKKDFGAGIMYMVIGLFFAIIATGYKMGTAAKMGPGYFPFWLGVLMTALGLFITIRSFSKKADPEEMPPWNWKIVLWITGSVVLYGLLLPILGFVITIIILVVVSASVSHEFGWKGAVLNAVALAAFSYLAFIFGLGLQFPIMPVFLE
ncbi:tripartite tricarboxylate transporter TctB family protein [Polynucleobacter sp. HIN6]|uniref:tripartite tricarboxylate transporter TctB family protein n=1 Tax=unclassified Polynucleobacter TaxID=2640945 RepID=UPI0025733F0E|nr:MULTISPECIES: tripartite tricarboxylate transporter TctB family protein [unclassified Polynucleobacter]BEI35909.1 tripartite tricarboxylate transporter TctB family protein [Polynucleobacter sp. HIN6]BEI41491.1 tripartite tricarboxylate transporter TctB family protein [Polynucleobacter sp. HIN9]